MVSPFTGALAHLLAKGHAHAALMQFNELQRIVHERKESGAGVDFEQYMQWAVPSATSLALALELALKVVYFQNFAKYPRTHNLEELVNALPPAARDEMEWTYAEQYARDIPLNIMHIAFSFADGDEAQPTVAAPDLSLFSAGLSHASSAYVKWRYFYEHMESPQATQIHFKALLALVEAAHATIQAHKGDATVRIGGG